MKNLMDKHTIIKLKQQGYSNRAIAKLTKIDRKTVSKYWGKYIDQINQLNDNAENICLAAK